MDIARELGKKIVGQQKATDLIGRAVNRAETGEPDSARPRGSFLLLGPTGVGKTQTATSLARILHQYRPEIPKIAMRFDMAELQRPEDVGRFLGTANSAGALWDVWQWLGGAESRGRAVWLFDEIEKADPNLVKIFLSILDEGRATNYRGDTMDLSNAYIVMTSNLGAKTIARMGEVPRATMRRVVTEAAKNYFAPELLARFQERVVYHTLSFDHQCLIAEKLLLSEIERYTDRRGVAIRLTQSAVIETVQWGYSYDEGARPLRNMAANLVADAYAAFFENGEICDDLYLVRSRAGGLCISASPNTDETVHEFGNAA